ncbi:MAG: GerMN domain-containing protein [Deltaproteobacteria bacterium]|nr:GerMN domain-containing protein [Deltaproteobacteria bacterium]
MAKKKTTDKTGGPANGAPRKRPRSRKAGGWLIVIIIAIITVIAGIVLVDRYGDRIFRPIVEKKIKETAETREINVYWSDEDGERLKAERRLIKKGSLENEIKEALGLLIEGPLNRTLGNTIPEGVKLLGVRVKGQTATADFSSEMVRNHPGGSTYEILTIYSVVDTVALNFPEIKEVRLLVDGKKTGTIAGHIDASVPFTPDASLINN